MYLLAAPPLFSLGKPPVLEVDNPKDTACATSLIQTYIPRASLRGCSGGELSYVIPQDADRACFRGLFQALDQNLQHLHLTGYGISDTTLEEVRRQCSVRLLCLALGCSELRAQDGQNRGGEGTVCIFAYFPVLIGVSQYELSTASR